MLAAEVLWTPKEPWEVLSKEDAMADLPDLLDPGANVLKVWG